MAKTEDYLLGVNQFELDRLRFQHNVWKEITDSLFDRLNIQNNWKILDAGSGPGYVSMDLLERISNEGEITALEPSETYLNYFKNYCSENSIRNVKFVSGTVETAALPENYYDLIFARWVIGFVPDPDQFIASLSRSLAPGGIIAFEDYAFHGLFLYPRGNDYEKINDAVQAYWKLTGGDLCIAPRIPSIFKKFNIELVDFKPNSIAGRPGSGIFQWHHYFITHHVPLMAEKGIITKETGEAILADWMKHSENPDAIFFSPLVVDVAGKINSQA